MSWWKAARASSAHSLPPGCGRTHCLSCAYAAGFRTPALNGLGITTLADAQHWEWDTSDGGAVRTLGRDLRLHLRPEPTEALEP